MIFLKILKKNQMKTKTKNKQLEERKKKNSKIGFLLNIILIYLSICFIIYIGVIFFSFIDLAVSLALSLTANIIFGMVIFFLLCIFKITLESKELIQIARKTLKN